MEEKENNTLVNARHYAENLVERTYEYIARIAIRPAWWEIDELKSKLAATETMVKRLEKERKKEEDRANKFEKEVFLWKFIWSIFGKQRNSDNLIK